MRLWATLEGPWLPFPPPRTKGLGKKCWLQRASPGHLKYWQYHPLLKVIGEQLAHEEMAVPAQLLK